MGRLHAACNSGSEPEGALYIHTPMELVQQAFVEHLLNRHLIPLTPGDGDAWVHVVDL